MSSCKPCGGESGPYQYGGYQPGQENEPEAVSAGPCDQDDPCVDETPETPSRPCPNKYCHPSFRELGTKRKMRLVGAVGQCLYQFNQGDGFVVGSGREQEMTRQPAVKVPFLEKYQTNSSGQAVLDGAGMPIMSAPPKFGSFYVADRNDKMWRLRGQTGQRQHVVWDNDGFSIEEMNQSEENPWIDEDNIPVVDGACLEDLALEQCITPEVIDGVVVNRVSYRIARRKNPSIPYGVPMPFMGSADNIPEGYAIADGRTESVEKYPAVFGAIGYQHGGSNQTFRFPDMRGMFVRGVDGGAGNDPDANSRDPSTADGTGGDRAGSIQSSAMMDHHHVVSYRTAVSTAPEITNIGRASCCAGSGYTPINSFKIEGGGFDTEGDPVTNIDGHLDGDVPEDSADLEIDILNAISGDRCADEDDPNAEVEVACESRPVNISAIWILYVGCPKC